MKINLHIERLVLDGLPVAGREGAQLQAAVESELARLLIENGLSRELQSNVAVPHLPAAEMRVRSAERPRDLGLSIARAVHQRLVTHKAAGIRDA
jgi:hypothetical protein